MARYTSDDNKVIAVHESGTWGTLSGNAVWIGQVASNSLTDNLNYQTNRYMGTGSRTFVSWEQGNSTAEGTLTYRIQDWRFPFWAIGSTYDVSGTNSLHTATEILAGARQSAFTSGTFNPPLSFTLEDSKAGYGTGDNFVRKIYGAVPNVCTITINNGEMVTNEMTYIGQGVTFTSGTPTTAPSALSTRPYYYSDASFVVGGSTLQSVKSATFEINNNVDGPFYLNGSQVISVPIQGVKDYILTLTLDMYSPDSRLLYNELYKGNATFNATLDLNGDNKTGITGSYHAIFAMSGCKVISADIPTPSEGVNEATFEIRAQNVSATAYDRVPKYNPW
jgi:hypothetical protein